jgi:enoyl-CoA hydratase
MFFYLAYAQASPPSPATTMAYTTLLFDLADGIATITINRPDKLNALNATVIGELNDAAGRVADEPEIRAALLTGAGTKAFVAGADIGEIGGQNAQQGQARARAGQQMMRRFERCGKPVLAAVNGFALGGGC